jgi:hypothetical protein
MTRQLLLRLAFYLVLPLALVWVAIYAVTGRDVCFVPAEFLQEYWKFVGGVLAGFVSFAIANLLWNQALEEGRARRAAAGLKAKMIQYRERLSLYQDTLTAPLANPPAREIGLRLEQARRLRRSLAAIAEEAAQSVVLLESMDYGADHSGLVSLWRRCREDAVYVAYEETAPGPVGAELKHSMESLTTEFGGL